MDNPTTAPPKLVSSRYKQLRFLLVSQCLFGLIYWFLLASTYPTAGIAEGEALIGFSIRGLLLAPIYWLIFIKYRNRSLQFQLLLHAFIIYIYLMLSLYLYQVTCKLFGVNFLIGTYGNWDLFIPALIYIIQFFCLHIWEYFIKLKEQKEKEIELLQVLHGTELKMLKAQIQPHFLFNSLNSINATIPLELETTRESISQLADVFRFALNASKQQLILISEEVSFIKSYLNIELRRYGTRLSVVYKVEPDTLEHYLPPMLLQPIVENCIKHAVDPNILPVSIAISIFKKESEIVFQIADTGPGLLNRPLDELLSKGTGLFNVRQRLLTQFGQDLSVKENIPNGLFLSFSLPSNLTYEQEENSNSR